ncbi:hypothetical protein F511_00638 [Dorcoceras hygrometricum]|nr:hypothetical protein F511_00638 [Dorcoceras hygrometricum]
MENKDTGSDHGKKKLRRSSHSHISMSDTESATSRGDSFHSPRRSDSDDPPLQTENDDLAVENNCKALVPVDMYTSPVPSPRKSNNQASFAAAGSKEWRPRSHSEKPPSENCDPPPGFPTSGRDDRGQQLSSDTPRRENHELHVKGATPMVVGLNKLAREEPPSQVKKVEPVGGGVLEEGKAGGGEDEVGGERRSRAAVESILRRSGRDAVVRKAALVIRIFEVVACVISFSIMAADRTQGWSGDSFDRYKEYRYCLAVNVVGFVYSGFQASNLAYHLGTGKDVIAHHLRHHFDFSMDQILAYFLMSASSSAATRVDDWITNWGSDKFTMMASASIAMSFLAFLAFSVSSLVSGYSLCNRVST